MNLTTAQLRYLIMIYQLQKNGRVRLLDVAGKLGVAKPSVHRMAVQLVRLELLEEGRFSVLRMTARGLEVAEAYEHGCILLHSFLQSELQLSSADAQEGALALLGALQQTGRPFVYDRLITKPVPFLGGAGFVASCSWA